MSKNKKSEIENTTKSSKLNPIYNDTKGSHI